MATLHRPVATTPLEVVVVTIPPDLTIEMLPVVVAVATPQDYPLGLLVMAVVVVVVVTRKAEVVVVVVVVVVEVVAVGVAVTAQEHLPALQPPLQVVAIVTPPPGPLDQSVCHHQPPLR